MKLIAACLAALMLPLAAIAQPTAVPNLAGYWKFTAEDLPGCTFEGHAILEKVSETEYVGDLTAKQSCPNFRDHYIVEQNTSVTVSARGKVSVRSKIRNFISGDHEDLYYPDDFELRVRSRARMTGGLVGPWGSIPAQWTRADGAIS